MLPKAEDRTAAELPLLAKLHAGRSPIAAEQDHRRAIKTEGFRRSTTGWREPKDLYPISTPRKMMRPYVSMGMEQRNDTPGKWIVGRETLGFVAIAGRATQAQIVKLSAASGTARRM